MSMRQRLAAQFRQSVCLVEHQHIHHQIEVFQAGWNRWKPQGNGAWGACVAQETRLAGGAARCFSAEAAAAETPPRRPGMSWLMVGSTLAAATGGYAYLQWQLHKAREQQAKAQEKSVGTALVGGPFTLSDCYGKPFPSSKLHGEFAILYFGFTHCPDICPDELEKMAEALNIVEKKTGRKVQSVFITIDPERDSGKLIKEYVHEFHPRMIGLRGSLEEVKKVAKLFRVYFMKTNDSKTDYLVDHSIIMYLLDPDGEFVTFYGKSFTAEQIADSLGEHIANWKA